MKLYNTLSKKIEDFAPLNPPAVTMYSCGPTVYDYTHIGHIRKYVIDDLLKRSLAYLGYSVNHVMNITDVGHLTGDDDSGSDKLEKGVAKTGKTIEEVVKFYTDFFFETMDAVNIQRPSHIPKATEYVPQMIEINKKLVEKGHAYDTEEALYYDVSTFPEYGKLSGQRLEDKMKAVREEVYEDKNKRNGADFSLWFKRVGRFSNHLLHWPSPWGEGFPGWHIECSAMAMSLLGETVDIHTGGIDHIPVHHENEIAQSEGATGKQFVKYWLHCHMLNVDGEKMSKSKGNFYMLKDIKEHHIDPVSLRLLIMHTHYRQPMNFTWEAAQGADEAYQKLKNYVLTLKSQTQRTMLSEEKLQKVDEYRDQFAQAIGNDLQMSQAMAVVWEMLKSNIPSEDKLDLLYEFDQVLGLDLKNVKELEVPKEIIQLAEERIKARQEKDFTKSDELRKQIE
ncbi:cysteine--tRNA ligase, partial [Candidatus Roizmanbacteria bacterium]|nr:cysteine--tRNA ligase [Candidatus Roizmanbacteria bacterium]